MKICDKNLFPVHVGLGSKKIVKMKSPDVNCDVM